MTITAAADGSSLGNPGPAGWAWVIDDDRWDAGGWPSGTNNLGELTAILELLRATAAAGYADEPLHILADSQYAINVVSKWMHGWKKRGWVKADKKPIKNLDVIQDIDREIRGRQVTFEWVKGHAGHRLNEMADDRARECAQAYQDGKTPTGGPGLSGSHIQTSTPKDEDTQSAPSPATAQEASASASNSENTEATQIIDSEKSWILAWMNGDEETITTLEDPDFRRVWPNGRVTDSTLGPVPASLTIGRIAACALASGLWTTRYTLSWDGGSSVETSIWRTRGTREHPSGDNAGQGADSSSSMRIVHHQSTLIS
ncbi:ribonuclease HI [Schaalia sp. ZJ405]|uniref:ribonuclease H family protein n=1 Tax=Schaalia sp. ZJ405 TaxID=2709403 RepID=UPI0013EAD0CD|nr:ribonuclease H [Schaalia sp. ZJ405]QPK81443.1 ribonuclease HI [Schaalia sp. ZJ405]